MYQDKKVLLIAGGGTLGTYVGQELLRKGCFVDVVCLNDPVCDDERIHYIKANADQEFLKRHLRDNRYDGIVNFIHYPDVAVYKPIHQLLSANAEHLIFLSSYRIYADTPDPITEETPKLLDVSQDADFLRDKTYYALAKAVAEQYLRNESNTSNWTAVRPVISFSSTRLDVVTQSGRRVIECAKSGDVLELPLEARERTAGLDWAGNSGKLIANLLFKEQAYGQSYTISSGQNLTWGQVAEIYRELTGVNIAWIDTQTYLEKYHKNDPYILLYDRLLDRRIDNSKVLQATGLSKKDFLSIREGVQIELNKL